uniref:RING-type domain-containing protein n=2 Tax=Oryza rufipogon TaxID=4529 RepID=A0A0E0N7R2_ORYRU
MAAAAAAAASASSSSSSSSSAESVPLPTTTLPIDKAAAIGGGGDRAVDCGVCAICLDKIALQETALVKGCDHAYCVTCILRWASYKQTPQCPHIHDYMFEESVCLLLRATWFEPLIVEAHEEALDEEELYHIYQCDDGVEDDLDEEAYYMSRSPSIRIGNRRWGDNGYVRGGRKEARPVSRQSLNDTDAGPSRTPKKKDVSASGSGSVSKEVAGRRAKRALKREAADKAAAEKHLKHLQRLGLRKAPEATAEATPEVEPQLNEWLKMKVVGERYTQLQLMA